MGNGNYIICQKCEYEREFLLGAGMLWGNIENIIGFMDKSSKEEASKILQENPDPHYKTDGNCVYQCQKCFSLREKIHLLIYNKDGKIVYRTQSNCIKCKGKRKRLKENSNGILDQIICPKCKSNEVNVSEGLCWD